MPNWQTVPKVIHQMELRVRVTVGWWQMKPAGWIEVHGFSVQTVWGFSSQSPLFAAICEKRRCIARARTSLRQIRTLRRVYVVAGGWGSLGVATWCLRIRA